MTSVNLFDPAIKPDPYPAYESVRDEGPVAFHDELPMAIVTGFEEATAVLNDPATFSSGAGRGMGPDLFGAPVMLFADPPDHGRLRGPVSKAFTPRTVAGLAPRIEQLAAELVSSLEVGQPWDVVPRLSSELPVIVIAEALAIPVEDREQFKRWSDDLISVNTITDPDDSAEAINGALELRAYIGDIVASRRQHRGDDLVSRFVAANADGSINDAELLAACVLLLVAGNETTTNLISNAVLALARRPSLRAELGDDPALVGPFLEEILRWDPPVQGTARFTTGPATIGDAKVDAGQMVMVLLAAADRDPRRFNEPAELQPTRADAGHVAFGHGIHFCVGAALARLEARAAITALLSRADRGGWELAEPDGPLTYGPSFFLRGLTALPITTTAGPAADRGEH
jgi:cytochrome P450